MAVGRHVRKRDGGRCTSVDETGPALHRGAGLELHHDDAFGFGGDHYPDTVRLLCGRHNIHLAERFCGKEIIDKYRKFPRGRKREGFFDSRAITVALEVDQRFALENFLPCTTLPLETFGSIVGPAGRISRLEP